MDNAHVDNSHQNWTRLVDTIEQEHFRNSHSSMFEKPDQNVIPAKR